MIESIVVMDIETLRSIFLVCVYDPKENKNYDFEVSRRKNQMDSLLKFIETHKEYYWVSYNGLRFDAQVVEWIIRNHDNWIDLSTDEIVAKIYQKAQDIIDDANYDMFPEYREEDVVFKQIDVFKVNHLDNKMRRVSLKRLMFELDMENIEEIPVDHKLDYLSDKEMDEVISYCHNDVFATYQVYKLTIGDTTHPLYRDNNQIQLRLNIEEEFELPCLNYSDSKIGDEMIKKFYCKEKGISVSELPKKGFFRKEIKANNCIAKYIKFETRELQSFLKDLRRRTFKLKDEFKESIHFYGNVYSFKQGGLHTEQSPAIFESTEDVLIIDYDVASYYPAIIINNGQYPFHLGREFLVGYKKMFERRLQLKPLAKTDKKIAGIVGALKLAVNSVFGKTSDMQNWMYDRQVTLFTTLTGELSLMMLIEAYELNGIKVISANT